MVAETNETDINRPYGPPANTITVLARLRSRNLPERIDAEYLRDAAVSEGTVNRTVFGMTFLGLIDETGRPSQETRAIHAATDEEYRDILSTLIRTAYAEVFESMNPAEDTQERIVNFFRRYAPASQRSRMVSYFLGMCREAGIATLDAPRQRPTGAGTQRTASSGTARAPGRSAAKKTGGSPQQQQSPVIPSALEGLVRSLPEPGKPLSEARRKQWLAMAEATLAFVYPTETDEDEEGGQSSEQDQEKLGAGLPVKAVARSETPTRGPVAQLGESSGFEPVGRRFKSCRGLQIAA